MRLHRVLEGEGPPLLLSSSLGTTHRLWDTNVGALARRFRVVRYDHPGHGGSPPGPRTIEGLARAALSLLDELGLERVAFCGLSLGGMVGMWLGAHAPERLDRLVLACTAPRLPPAEQWLERAETVRREGMEAIADAVLARWFTPGFAGDRAPWRAMLVSTPPEGYARCCEAIAAADLRAELRAVRVPLTVILGRHDPVIGDEARRLLAEAGPVVELDAAHLANVEQPEAFAEAVLAA
ncbi:MAG TPA: alpha/beta fold hydrolase [Gaiellaceae bacterium]|nr:alpha/beta fold hydrolase [Gaiellaceae bacterium]